MIRKIVLLTVILFVTFWVAGAHLLKAGLTSRLSELNSDNLKIFYKEAKISGFPFSWKIKLQEPQIVLVGELSSYEISTGNISFDFNYLLNLVSVDFSDQVNLSREKAGVTQYLSLKGVGNFRSKIKFKAPIYFADSWQEKMDSAEADLPDIRGVYGGREAYVFFAPKFLFVKAREDSIDKYTIKLAGNYTSSAEDPSTRKAYLETQFKYLINNGFGDGQTFSHQIDVEDFTLKMDETKLHFRGFINLLRNKLPNGKFDVEVSEYNKVVDTLLPEHFVIPISYIKRVIAKMPAIDSDDPKMDGADKKFNLKFSDDGIFIGEYNLLDIKQ